MTHLLATQNAIIYGAGGGIGRGVARAFAAQGATVHLVGRHPQPLDKVAATVASETQNRTGHRR